MDVLVGLLDEVLALRTRISELEKQEQDLRERIRAHMAGMDRETAYIESESGMFKLHRSTRVTVSYDEETLAARLGPENYLRLCSVNRAKLKAKWDQLPEWLGDNFTVVAGLDRGKVEEAVRKGDLDPGLFKGAFNKETREVLSITNLRGPQANAPGSGKNEEGNH